MVRSMLVHRTLNRFIRTIRDIQNTYTAYPYFSSPERTLEKNIIAILSLKEQRNFSPQDIDSVIMAMEEAICFTKDRIPSTAIDKFFFIERLDEEYHALKEHAPFQSLCTMT